MLEIAGGIVLAVLLVAFWRWIAVGAALALGFAVLIVVAALVAGGVYLWSRDLPLAVGMITIGVWMFVGLYSGHLKRRDADRAESRRIERLLKQHGH